MQQTSCDLTFVRAGSDAHGTETVRTVRDPAGLDGLAKLWERLSATCESPCQQFAWTQAAATTFARRRSLHVVVVENGAMSAILPLVRRVHRSGPRLEILSSRETFEPMDAVCPDRPSAHALAEVLASQRHPLFLTRLPADSLLVRALRDDSYSQRVSFQQAPGSPWLPLDRSWLEPEAHFTSRRRADLRRARRIAQSIGPVTCEIVSPTPSTLEPLLDQAFQVEAAGWKGRSGTALLHDRARGRFYRRFAAGACQHGSLRIGFLRIGRACAAMQLFVECGNRLWLLKMGYDPSFARCSPGQLLLVESVRHAASNGLSTYEFLGVEEPWLRPWGARIRPCLTLRAYPTSMIGRLQRFAARLMA